MRKGKGFDEIMASQAVFLTAEEVGKAAGWSPDAIRTQARNEPAALGFPVTVLGARTYIPRIPFLKHCGLLQMELIDRNALIEKLDGIWDCNDMVFEPDDFCDILADCKGCKWRETKEAIKRIVLHMPTIEAVPVRHGEWIHGREIGREWMYDHWVKYFEDWRCSNCGVVFKQESEPKYHYCPNCGAKMTP